MEKLTETQQQAAQAVLRALEVPSSPKIVFLEGLSGMGKSLVINSIRPEIAGRNAVVMEYLGLGTFGPFEQSRMSGQNVVSMGTPRELLLVKNRFANGAGKREVISHTLQGMTIPETVALIRDLRTTDRTTRLMEEQLVQYSLGIPLLVHQLLADPNINEAVAAHIAGHHLGHNLRQVYYPDELPASANKYLQIQPTEQMLYIASTSTFISKRIYDHLGRVFEGMEETQKAGINEESPLFVASESVNIYNRMLREGRHSNAWIDIFAPEINLQDLERLTQAFGFQQDEFYQGTSEVDFYYAEQETTRVKMFGYIYVSGYRKTAIWFRDTRGGKLFGENEGQDVKDWARAAEKDFQAGELPLKPSGRRGIGSFYFHRHGHHGESFMPASAGWMVESLLQRRDIPYLVNNKAIDEKYVYNPQNQSIEYRDFNITKRR